MQYRKQIPVIGFAGWSGSGKTTLVRKLIPELKRAAEKHGREEYHIAVIKHDAHGISLTPAADGLYEDTEGRDSWLFRKAGADSVLLCGPEGAYLSCRGNPDRTLYMERLSVESIQDIGGMTGFLKETRCPDLILVEGYKNGSWPRIGIARRETGKGLPGQPEQFLGVVTDDPAIRESCKVPVFMPEQIKELAVFLWDRLHCDKEIKSAYISTGQEG